MLRPGHLALALGLAFVSGLTSLAYQVLWTRQVAAGTGNSTYVFSTIVAIFLLGLAVGSILFTRFNDRVREPLRLIAFGQVATALFVIIGTGMVIDRHIVPILSASSPISGAFGTFLVATVLVVLPPTVLMGLTFPATSALVTGRDGHLAASAGALLAVNTLGSICGTFIVPFFVIPLLGSPMTVGVIAVVNVLVGLVLLLVSSRAAPRPHPATALAGAVALAILFVGAWSGRLFVDPTTAMVVDSGGMVFANAEDEIAPVVSGEIDGVKQLWVTGSSMTVLTVDAKLMPLLPLMLRPDSTHVLVVAFGMGSAYRSSLIAGLATDAVELVPSVPSMFGHYYGDAGRYLDDPKGRVIVADGRNYVSLTPKTYDIVIVDPPPPIESSGVSVISSLEFYRAAHERLTRGGVMMQWVPWGQTISEFMSHVATFRAVFPHVIIAFGPGNNGTYMLGSDAPISFTPKGVRSTLEREGVLQDLGSAADSPHANLDQWIALIQSLVWIQGDEVAAFAASNPLITDDRPLPEYFLIRHLLGESSPQVSQRSLLAIVPGTGADGP